MTRKIRFILLTACYHMLVLEFGYCSLTEFHVVCFPLTASFFMFHKYARGFNAILSFFFSISVCLCALSLCIVSVCLPCSCSIQNLTRTILYNFPFRKLGLHINTVSIRKIPSKNNFTISFAV